MKVGNIIKSHHGMLGIVMSVLFRTTDCNFRVRVFWSNGKTYKVWSNGMEVICEGR